MPCEFGVAVLLAFLFERLERFAQINIPHLARGSTRFAQTLVYDKSGFGFRRVSGIALCDIEHLGKVCGTAQIGTPAGPADTLACRVSRFAALPA